MKLLAFSLQFEENATLVNPLGFSVRRWQRHFDDKTPFKLVLVYLEYKPKRPEILTTVWVNW